MQNTTPPTVRTNFSCFNRPMGFYADVEANCKIYHTCDDHGNKFSYRCPEETAFRQDALICDHAHLVDCQATTYPPNVDKYVDNARASTSIKAPDDGSAVGSLLDDRPASFSRSFRVIQRSDKSVPNNLRSDFVFSASLFLKDQERTGGRAERISDTAKMCNAGPQMNRMKVPQVARTLTGQDPWQQRPRDKADLSRGSFPSSPEDGRASFTRDSTRSFVFSNSSRVTKRPMPANNISQASSFLSPSGEKSAISLMAAGYDNDYRPYSDTLRSMQINFANYAKHESTRARPTTEIPVHALTLSLKPLIPNELEYDPYYPKQPTSTEAYYTPSKADRNVRFFSSSQAPPMFARTSVPFTIPSVLPDLNTLEDLVDRRKLFYIPRVKWI